jgi:transcriptional regulator with GAF, ATPase, and Fis domain
MGVTWGKEAEMTREARMSETFADLAEVLVGDYGLAELLHRLADSCVAVCDAAGAGIVVADQHGELRDMAYSSEDIRRLERFQLLSDEGPCVECYRTGHLVEEPDLASAQRWPRFSAQAADIGIGSARAVPLRLRGQTLGALNLFHAEPGRSPARVLRAAQALADLAVLGIVLSSGDSSPHRTAQTQIRTALQERSAVERAKGFLAESGEVSMDEAFDRMRAYADERGERLTAVARNLISRSLPPATVLETTVSDGRAPTG